MRILWCEEHGQAEDGEGLCHRGRYLQTNVREELVDMVSCRMVPMRLIPDNDETVERAAEALYYWDDDSGSVLISWRYENEAPHKESNRDYYRRGVQAVLAALDGETP